MTVKVLKLMIIMQVMVLIMGPRAPIPCYYGAQRVEGTLSRRDPRGTVVLKENKFIEGKVE
jgi:hypothetical protein